MEKNGKFSRNSGNFLKEILNNNEKFLKNEKIKNGEKNNGKFYL